MPLTLSQSTVETKVVRRLSNREIVCLHGEKQGKSYIVGSLKCKYSSGMVPPNPDAILNRKSKKTAIEIMEGVQMPGRSDKIELASFQRQILEYFGRPNGLHPLKMYYKYRDLLVDLKKANIVPVFVVDSVEVTPTRGLDTLKQLNQHYFEGEHIGVAVLVSGNICQQKLDRAHFFMHASEVKVGKVHADEVRVFVASVVPEHRQRFTQAAYKKLAECRSTAEMRKLIFQAVENWEVYSDDSRIDIDILTTAAEQLRKAA